MIDNCKDKTKNPIKNAGKKPGLTRRQKKFIEHYLQTGNIAESVRKAGYSAKNASAIGNVILRNKNVNAELTTRMKQLEEKGMAKTEEIIMYLTSVMRGEHEDEQLMNIGIGDGKTQAEKHSLRVASKERLKAAELLGKIRGLFVTKQEVELSGKIPVVIKDDI